MVHPVYKKALDATHPLRHRGKLRAPKDGEIRLQTEEGTTSLGIVVSPEGRVIEASHGGTLGMLAVLYDRLCDILLERPLQEGAEHATIKLEQQLRDPEIPHPIRGLITPENADPIFAVPLRLVRDLYDQYRVKTGTPRQWNDWEDPPSSEWSDWTDEEKISSVARVLQHGIEELKLAIPRLDVLQIKNGKRVVLAHSIASTHPAFGHCLMQLERRLKDRLEPHLELVLESLEDKNQRESRTHRDKTFSESEKSR